ncbi:hypothetical protein HNQ85_003503 [Anoxybacillus calidus]|uniref:Uncharacterized protein n=1 Tax=[Anoxybacillus] calidus TaxID=575178 RepID=A0A7V9Z3C0_9BACL|nr:hypothetical protein [Anoxybacillus calidus]MBA2873165.1 hypothetical protein [Anoxybacillus calidus]
MGKHLYSTMLSGEICSSEGALIRDLKYLIKEERELDDQVREFFPLEAYGELDEELKIRGSRELLAAFDQIDAEKQDFIETLENIELIGFSDKNQIILRFKKDDLNATGIYNFTYEFLNDLFDMGMFSKFCLERGYTDLLRENIEELFEKLKTEKRQYRLIKHQDDWFLRGITSTRYNNYDNHLAIYLILLALHSYAKKNKTFFIIEKAYMSDSEIKVFFQLENPIVVPGVGEVYFGALLSNNEIRDKTFSLELRYKIVDKTNNFSFGAVSKLEDAVFNINHSTSVNNVREKIQNVFNLEEYKNLMLGYINELKHVSTLSADVIYLLFKKITNSKQKLSTQTKKKAKDLYDKNLINNTMNLIELFNRVSEITSDVEESIYLERIYHEVILELSSKN